MITYDDLLKIDEENIIILLNTIIDLTSYVFFIIFFSNNFKNKYDKITKNLLFCIQDSGPVFIKYFQILASKRYTINFKDKKIIDTLEIFSKLEDNVLISDNIKKKELEIIKYFKNIRLINTKPLGIGSIASVYNIKYNNKNAVIKIVHPGIEDKINKGYINLNLQIKMASNMSSDVRKINKLIDIHDIVSVIKIQTDMTLEGNNILIMNKIFKDDPVVKIPQIFFYSKKAIIMEKINGYKYYDFIIRFPEFQDEAIAAIFYTFKKMIINKCIHCDFHYGNFFIDIIDDKVIINLLDFGIVKYISDLDKENFLVLFDFKSSEIDKIKAVLKFLWNLTKCKEKKSKFYSNYNDFEEKFLSTQKIDNLELIDIINYLKKIDVKISYYNSLLINSLEFIFSIINKTYLGTNKKFFYKFLLGYLFDIE